MTNVTVSERATRIAAMLADVPVKGLTVGSKPYVVLHALDRDAIVDLLASIPALEAEIREECAAGQDQAIAARLEQFSEALTSIPLIAERVAKGQQFNCYDSAKNHDDMPDEDCTMILAVGPISDARWIGEIRGRAQAEMVEAALKHATLSAIRQKGQP